MLIFQNHKTVSYFSQDLTVRDNRSKNSCCHKSNELDEKCDNYKANVNFNLLFSWLLWFGGKGIQVMSDIEIKWKNSLLLKE
jgi:hypothetical protein